MGEVLIKVEGISKKFAKDLKKSLLYGLSDVFIGITRKKQNKALRKDEFWAVKDINFEVKRGECLGLIGHNGAGKSTLLKILNGLIAPDEGSVTIYGKVGALIELGAGFNPILTGRENVYNNAALIGFSRYEIDAKFNDIVVFSELEEFIDMPVQNYSSGMKVRLGFAVAAQMEPDVLIIDEVLAVGDLGFVLKCFKTIDTILPQTAVIFVSHTMPMISRICNQIILMENGKSLFHGNNVGKAIDLYYTRFAQSESNAVFDDGSLALEKVEILNAVYEKNIPQLKWGDNLVLYLKLKVKVPLDSVDFNIIVSDKEQRSIAILERNQESLNPDKENKFIEFKTTHQNLQFSKGIYYLSLAIRDKKTKVPVLRINNVISFQIIHPEEVWEPFLLKSKFEIMNSNSESKIHLDS
jgi:lipopolysaccharide transport system ATP-binding protein